MPGVGKVAIPSWLRRAVEAAIAAGLVAVVSLVGSGVSAGANALVVPRGPAGLLLLSPSVLALSVIPVAWPTGMAATRADALFGCIAGFLIAADATVLLASGRILLEGPGLELPVGFLAVLLAAAPALAGVIAGQLRSPVGFGRQAGATSAVVAAIAALVMVGGLAMLPALAGNG